MAQSLRIVGIAGSLRAQSCSRAVLDTLAERFQGDAEFTILDIGAMPHYNQDHDGNAHTPTAVADGREQVAQADAVIIVTPEYNHGLPGVLKNALDWLSRPAFTSCFCDKPVFFITVAPGVLGGVRAQHQMRETMSSMLCRLFPLPEVAITQVKNKIENHRLVDPAALEFTDTAMTRFLAQLRQFDTASA
ncbi:NADPH-dependent FMN reductase [Salinisphaera aquimarina]|uniref:NADPH-dependent FMN reductase n=1 Tax=Salinisphaera aquimarina TaxID=2094031 RepID=A0ABV7EUF2_9GAMM